MGAGGVCEAEPRSLSRCAQGSPYWAVGCGEAGTVFSLYLDGITTLDSACLSASDTMGLEPQDWVPGSHTWSLPGGPEKRGGSWKMLYALRIFRRG